MAESAAKPTRFTLEQMRELAKAELHCHLDGSIRVKTVLELAKEQNVALPTSDEAELKKLVMVGENCESLEEYLKAFEITLSVLQEAYALTRVIYEICEDAKKEGVWYIEVRFSPILHMSKGLNLSQIMEAICEGQSLAERHLGINVRIIVCGMRQMAASVTIKMAEIAWRYRNKGVSGFDLAGPELGFGANVHRSAFEIIRKKCLNVTLHSGEGAGWESIEESILTCGVNRIGHGTRLVQNDDLLQVVANRRITIESCVTSNIQTKAVATLAEHPIRKFFDAGLVVVPCCDNCTVSDVQLSGEYMLIQDSFNFTPEEILRMTDYGFSSAFLEPSRKKRLRQDALRHNVTVLQKYGFDVIGPLNHLQFSDVVSPCVQDDVLTHFMGTSVRPNRDEVDPKITLDLIRKLPKADLHASLSGSAHPRIVWKGAKEQKLDLEAICGTKFADEESFIDYWQKCDSESVKLLSNASLQSREVIEEAVTDVLASSFEDGVRYIEMAVRLSSHSNDALSEEEVLQLVINTIGQFRKKCLVEFWCNVVVVCSTTNDDPVKCQKVAELAVKYHNVENGVCGVGFYGRSEIPPMSYTYYRHVFNYLARNYIPVAIHAGLEDEAGINSAMHDGGASRISGAFSVHRYPRLMSYMAAHNIPVELAVTTLFEERKKSSWQIFGSPIRLLMDNGVPVTVCSFRKSTHSLSQRLFDVVQQCNLDAIEVIELALNGFRYNFQPIGPTQYMLNAFRCVAVDSWRAEGFKFFGRKTWVAPE